MDDNKLIKTNSNSLIKANNNLFSRALNDLDDLEFSEISYINIIILGFRSRSAYLPEYVPILSYLYKEFKDTNIKLFPFAYEAEERGLSKVNCFLDGGLCDHIFYSTLDECHDYNFTLKKQKSNVETWVHIRTFMPEFLEGLGDKEIINPHWKEHLYELIQNISILFLFDGLEDDKDSRISQSVNYLKNYLSNSRDDLIRIPVIFYNFDHPELYPYKDDIDSFLKQKFPLTKKAFDDWGEESKITIRYFPCSLFGVVNNNGKIESNGIYYGDNDTKYWGVLNSREHWKPFGVLSPIYWLLTGKYDPNFLEI